MSTPKSRKAKGRRLQNEVRQKILHKFPSISEDLVDVAIMGESGNDVRTSGVAGSIVPLDFECKNTEKLNVWKAIEQAESNKTTDKYPVVVFKRNRSDIYATLKLDDLLEILKNANL